MALRRPSQRSVDLYNQLVAQQNKVRKQLIRIHKNAEEALGAGRLPSLVIPRSAKRITRDRFYGLSTYELRRRAKEFWRKYHEAQRLFAGKRPLGRYLGRTLVDGYREIWIEKIFDGVEPEGKTGKYTSEQIEMADKNASRLMEIFNMFFARGREMFFLSMLNAGEITQFRYIYQEFDNGLSYKEDSWAQQQIDSAMRYMDSRGRLRSKEIEGLDTRAGLSDNQVRKINKGEEEAETYSGRNRQSTIREAEKRQARAERRKR